MNNITPNNSIDNRDQPTVDEQAQDWFVNLRSQNVDINVRRQFKEWQQQDETHKEAYEKTEALWEKLGEINDCEKGRALVDKILYDEELPQKNNIRFKSYLNIGGLAASIIIISSLIFVLLPKNNDFEISTVKAEVLKQVLPDESILSLTPQSKVLVSFSKNLREVKLLKGKVFFDVAHDPARPFVVTSQHLEVTVTGTSFSVSTDNEVETVKVSEGSVRVQKPSQTKTRSDPVLLDAGYEIRGGAKGLNTVKKSQANEYENWQKGLITLNDIKLEEAIKLINRYLKKDIKLSAASVADMEISITINLNDIGDFPTLIEEIFPLKAIEDDYGNIVFIDDK